MQVTLKELAMRANVHPSTISRVANNDPSLRIATATRQRIEGLLRETGYQPNGIARGLKMRQTKVVAVVIPDITNPFFAALFRGVEDAASPRGFNVLLCNTDGLPDRQRSHLQSLQARRVDGVIVASSFLKDPSVRELRRQKGPYVLVNRFSDEGEDPFVGSDDLLGGQLATSHLIDLGHTRIGHLAGKPTVSTGVLRRRGFLAAHAQAGLSADPRLIIEAGYTEESGALAARRLLATPDPPTAVFAVTDMVAIGLAGVAMHLGFRIPEDLAIVGYNDIPLASRLSPGLTTMHVPIHEFGSVAVRLLLEQLESDSVGRRVRFTPDLIVRESTVAGAASAGHRARSNVSTE
ncbi:MAG TPA: LacI family DNA-binding transcriptional regulator [Candidatus Acidoferrales bacterium]|nr:LacI family DNA-binding transcriptional regulator [Candidatus Acidoferrales bacterium]